MKILNLRNGLALCLLTTSSLSMADVWQPINGQSIFFTLGALFNLPSTDTFGIFAANANVGTDTPILKFNGADTLTFNQVGSNFTISDHLTSGTLWETNNFQLGWLDSAGIWITESGSSPLPQIGANAYNLAFIDPSANTADNLHTLYAFDTMRAGISSFISSVPLPASVWMMFSGLLGILFTTRRKN